LVTSPNIQYFSTAKFVGMEVRTRQIFAIFAPKGKIELKFAKL